MRAPIALATALFLGAAPAAAQTYCFAPTAGGAATTHVTAGLGDRFRSRPDCRYGVRSVAGSVLHEAGPLTEGERDLPTFLRDAGMPAGRHELAADVEVYAVPPPSGDRAPLAQTLSLRPCLAHLGEGSTVVSFDDASGAPRLGAVHAPSCPSSDLELVVVERAGAGTLVTDDLAGAPVLPLGGSRSLTLAAGLRSAGIYLRTTGAPLALRIDSMRFADAQTPLQRLFADDAGPWFETDWRRGELRLLPRAASFAGDPMRWNEFVTASAADALFYAVGAAGGGVTFAARVDADGSALAVPDDAVHAAMRGRYGAPGAAMAPNRHDWDAVLASLRLCHAREYGASPTRNARASASELASMRCVSLAQLTAVRTGPAPASFTVERHLAHITRGAPGAFVSDPGGQTERVALDSETPVQLAAAGDRVVAPEDLPSDTRLVLCPTSDGQGPREGVALEARGGHTFVAAAAGLWTVVLHPATAPRCAPQDLALARIAVVDPARDWIPFSAADHDAVALDDPWGALRATGEDTFAITARGGMPEWRLRTTPDVTAAINGRLATPREGAGTNDDPPRLSRAIPTRLRVEPETRAPGPSALVVLVTARDTCPEGPEDLLPSLRALPAEGVFHAFLATERDGDGPGPRFTCLARARFRVTPPLFYRGTDAGPFYVRFGLPGSVELRTSVELASTCSRADCVSVGVALPLIYARISPRARAVSWLTLDASVPLLLSAAVGNGRALHTGTGVDITLAAGPFAIPRLFSVGVLVQPAVLGVTQGNDALNVAVHAGFDLGSLFDFVRGL